MNAETATTNVTVIKVGFGTDGEAFHVHGTGCADIARSYTGKGRQRHSEIYGDFPYARRVDIAADIYGDVICDDPRYDGTDESFDALAAEYLDEFRFFPCCGNLA